MAAAMQSPPTAAIAQPSPAVPVAATTAPATVAAAVIPAAALPAYLPTHTTRDVEARYDVAWDEGLLGRGTFGHVYRATAVAPPPPLLPPAAPTTTAMTAVVDVVDVVPLTSQPLQRGVSPVGSVASSAPIASLASAWGLTPRPFVAPPVQTASEPVSPVTPATPVTPAADASKSKVGAWDAMLAPPLPLPKTMATTSLPSMAAPGDASGGTAASDDETDALAAEGPPSGTVVAMKTVNLALVRQSRSDIIGGEVRVQPALPPHPHVVRAYAPLVTPDTVYLPAELCDAGDVFSYVGDRTAWASTGDGRDSVAEAARLASEMLAGLAHLHAQCVVHRDVKPENVYLHRSCPPPPPAGDDDDDDAAASTNGADDEEGDGNGTLASALTAAWVPAADGRVPIVPPIVAPAPSADGGARVTAKLGDMGFAVRFPSPDATVELNHCGSNGYLGPDAVARMDAPLLPGVSSVTAAFANPSPASPHGPRTSPLSFAAAARIDLFAAGVVVGALSQLRGIRSPFQLKAAVPRFRRAYVDGVVNGGIGLRFLEVPSGLPEVDQARLRALQTVARRLTSPDPLARGTAADAAATLAAVAAGGAALDAALLELAA